MLKSLKDYDSKSAEKILSELTGRLLPSPEVGEELNESAIYEEVKREIHKLLKVDPDDLSPSSRAKVFEFLAKEMSTIALRGANVSNIKSRLGQRGELRHDLYEIDFPKFFSNYERLGIRRNHVIDVIRNPEKFEPVLPTNDLLIYFKTINKLNDSNRFSLIVITIRKGYKLEALSAWRIYHSEIGISTQMSLVAVLQAFAERYGETVNLGDKQGKFILHETIEAGAGTNLSEIVRVPEQPPLLVHGYLRKSSIHRLYDITLVFAIDVLRYARDLRNHGVPAELTILPIDPFDLY